MPDEPDTEQLSATQRVQALLANPPEKPHSCARIETMWLNGQDLDDPCAEALAHAMRRGDLKQYAYLNLGNNSFSARGACAIAGAFAQGALPSLTSLSLPNNAILDDGFVALCAVADRFPLLATLEVMECGIAEVGASAMAAAARAGHMRNLQSVYLRGNRIGDAGIKVLCEALAEPYTNPNAVQGAGFPRLAMLQLVENQIGDEGCLTLAEAIEAGHVDHVRQFDLTKNVQTRDGFEVVHDVIHEYDKMKIKVLF